MKRLFALLCFFPLLIKAQTHTLSGYVRDAATGEELIGVNIVIPELAVGTSTNVYGYYSISVPPGQYQVEFQFLGFETASQKIDLTADKKLNLELKESATTLEEVEVTSERSDRNVSSVEMSVAKLSTKEIAKVPQLLGETDIIRTLTLLPGVTTVGEGSNGFNVRGGAADQNLILLDEAPVYNSSHLFGFFSIFNADAVKDVKLYKGGIPAEYGGRLSSVVDVRQKDGNKKEFAAEGGIGLLSSRLLVEGPIKKDEASFMVAGRRSYVDLFLGLSNDPDISQNVLYFYDINAKLNWQLSPKDKIYLSGYFGRDVFGIRNLFNFDWGNGTGSLRWNHLFSDKLFTNTTLVYSDYAYSIGTPEDDVNFFKLTSRIQNYHLKHAYSYFISPRHQLDFGFEGIYYTFRPGKIVANQLPDPILLQREYAVEPNLYISHEWKVNERLKLQYGLRYSSFYKVGKQNVLSYPGGQPSEDVVPDTIAYSGGELIKGFDGLEGFEPRVALNFSLTENTSFKSSYNRTRQYIHLISNTNSPTPVDLYRPSGTYIEPATVNQVAAGYFQNFADNTYEFSLEFYYKDFQDLVDYRPGADLIFTEYLETEILRGQGRAYGAEVLLRKSRGKLSGWIGYTLSRSERKVTGESRNSSINNGDWYPANYDKLHDLSVVASYQISEKWDIGTSFVFQTGRPYTPPSGKYEFEEITVPIYQGRNQERIPSYHRLDLSANYRPAEDPDKDFYSSWSFGVYNVYARRNPYSIYFQPESNDLDASAFNTDFFNTQAVRLSIFATAIPFVTWNFNF